MVSRIVEGSDHFCSSLARFTNFAGVANPAAGGDPSPRVENSFSKVVAFLATVFLQCAPALTLGVTLGSLMFFGLKGIQGGIYDGLTNLSTGVIDGLNDGLANIGSRKGGYYATSQLLCLPKLKFT